MKSFFFRSCSLLLLMGLVAMPFLQAQHFSITSHTNYLPRVADFSSQDLSGNDLQSLGLDLRIFSNKKWAFRLGMNLQGASVYDAFSDDYYVGGHQHGRDHDWDWDDKDWDDWDWDDLDDLDWDKKERHDHDSDFDYAAWDEDFDLFAEIGIERHIFLFNEKLDIYPGVYLPIALGPQTSLQQILGGDQLKANAGATLGASVRLLRIFRVGMEFDAGFAHTANGISQSFREKSLLPFKRIPYQTSMTFGLAF